jgi:hypothetical protein
MPYMMAFLSGLATGIVLDILLEKRAIQEIRKLQDFMAAELRKLSARL